MYRTVCDALTSALLSRQGPRRRYAEEIGERERVEHLAELLLTGAFGAQDASQRVAEKLRAKHRAAEWRELAGSA